MGRAGAGGAGRSPPPLLSSGKAPAFIVGGSFLKCNFLICLRFSFTFVRAGYQQYLSFEAQLDSLMLSLEKDVWQYIWGNTLFSSRKVYKILIGHASVHPVLNWLCGALIF
jgi:hypothetical protein